MPRRAGRRHLRRTSRACALAILAPLAWLAPATCATRAAIAQYGPVDPYASALRAIVDGVASTQDGEQHAAMVALRQLRDPTLEPLLRRLLQSDDWSLRVDSVLGLGEIDAQGMVDVALVGALPGDEDRDAAISAILGLRLADAARIEAMLAWDDVPALGRAMLAGELRRLGGRPDEALLRKLCESRTPEAAAIATAILLDLGVADADALAAKVRATIAASPVRSRSTTCAQVAEACAALELRGAAPFASSLLDLEDLAPDARMRALGSLLVLAPELAYPVFAKAIDADRSQVGLLRHGSILLASGARAPKAEWDRVRNGDALLEGLADAGTMLAEGRLDEGYARLVALKHRVTLRAALEHAGRGGASAERALGLACLALLRENRAAIAPVADSVMRALARLAAIAPEDLSTALVAAESDRELQEALLIVLASAATPEAAKVAEAARGRTSRVGETLVAVTSARGAARIEPESLALLANAAGGAAGVDPATRMQAAWLWLRHAGRTADAIDVLLGKLGLATPADEGVDPKKPGPAASNPESAPAPQVAVPLEVTT